MTKMLRCKGCGEINSIAEISLVPRRFYVEPDGSAMNGPDEAFWEAETVLGYACSNYECKFFDGDYGVGSAADGHAIRFAEDFETVAELIDSTQEELTQ